MSAVLRGIGGGISAIAATAGAIVFLALVALFVWWLGVFSSSTVGAGNVTRDQNSSQNREYWAAKYAADYQQVQADQTNLIGLTAYAKSPQATQQDRMNLEGAQQNCAQDVAAYNTDTASLLGRQWLPTGLPTTITATTYCGS
jgi:hypothetical protein